MIESELILNIIDVTLEGEKHAEQMTSQLKHLTEIEYEHTGNGMIVFLEQKPSIKEYRLSEEQLKETFGESNQELTKFELINDELKIQADVSVHFSNGMIDSIEIWNKLGDYPEDDLETWELRRLTN